MDTVDQPSVRPKTDELGQSGAKKYSMRGMPQLSQGTTNDPLATADSLWLSAKVYASGGENSLHIHTIEDHSFFVLQGEATFYFGDGTSCGVQQYEGGDDPERHVLPIPGKRGSQPGVASYRRGAA